MGNNNYNNNNNGAKRKGFTPNRKSKEEYEAERAAQIARQTKCLDILEDIASYLDNFLKTSDAYKVTMKEVLNYLNNDKGYSVDDTKIVSQLNYIMMDLANARKNKNVSGSRLNIRVMYIEERFKTSFKKELHDRVLNIIKTYNTLFAWDNSSDGDDYEVVNKKG